VWAAGHGRCRGGVIQPTATCNARTRVWGLMPGRSLRTRETVEVETPALSAMSLMVVDASAPQPMQLQCNRLIYSTVYGGYPVKLLVVGFSQWVTGGMGWWGAWIGLHTGLDGYDPANSAVAGYALAGCSKRASIRSRSSASCPTVSIRFGHRAANSR